MTVSAVGKNDNSCFNTVAKATALGAGAGYSLKYLWHVSDQEYGISLRRFLNMGRKVANDNKIDSFPVAAERTPAQDCFIKLIEADKKTKDGVKKAFSFENITKEVKNLGGEDSAAGKELRGIIRDVNSSARQISRRLCGAYKMMLKNKRPAIPFLVAGAGAGFMAGIIRNVMKNDV